MSISEPILMTRYKEKNFAYSTPNSFCEWRAKTLLTKEPETIKWLETFKPTDIFWDVGANIGLYSIFASVLTGCKTFAFEPESQNYAILNKNILFNKVDSLVQAYSIGISNITEINSLNLSKFEVGNSGHSLGNSKLKFSQGCISYSIDDLIDLGIPVPTHLKIDIDGLEHLVINGARKNLKSISSILIEINHDNEKHVAIINQLTEEGFTFDKDQVERTKRTKGQHFENYREYIFRRSV
jgi:FkbM family methyltransferase